MSAPPTPYLGPNPNQPENNDAQPVMPADLLAELYAELKGSTEAIFQVAPPSLSRAQLWELFKIAVHVALQVMDDKIELVHPPTT